MDGGGYAIAYAMSTAAGVRPFLTLAVTAWLVHCGNLIPASNFSWLGNDGVCVLLSLLAIIDFVADKVPFIDHLLHAVHFASKPIAGALVAGGTIHFADADSMHQATQYVLMGAAAANAFGLHVVTATARGVTTTFTFGTLNPFVSLLEDALCVVIIILAVVTPVAGLAISLLITLLALNAGRIVSKGVRMRYKESAFCCDCGSRLQQTTCIKCSLVPASN